MYTRHSNCSAVNIICDSYWSNVVPRNVLVIGNRLKCLADSQQHRGLWASSYSTRLSGIVFDCNLIQGVKFRPIDVYGVQGVIIGASNWYDGKMVVDYTNNTLISPLKQTVVEAHCQSVYNLVAEMLVPAAMVYEDAPRVVEREDLFPPPPTSGNDAAVAVPASA
jgi:hypothetical protein